METESYAIIGDIHGDLALLREMLKTDTIRSADRFIVLGDAIGGASCSKEVLDLLVRLKNEGRPLEVLQGNHEAALLMYLSDGDFVRYAVSGGLSVLRSYTNGRAQGDVYRQFQRLFPKEHSHLVRSLEPFWETNELFCSHAGLDPQHPNSRSESSTVCGSFPQLFSQDPGIEKLVVCGHYQVGPLPIAGRNFVCLDTGSGYGGPLSALLYPEMKYLQAQRTNGEIEIVEVMAEQVH